MNLNSFKSETLSKSEMANVRGGTHFCTCKGQAGAWYGNYENPQDMNDALEAYCRNGGICVDVEDRELD